jgi:hypothetical protein
VQQQLAILSGEQNARLEQAKLHLVLSSARLLQELCKRKTCVPNPATVANINPDLSVRTAGPPDPPSRYNLRCYMRNIGDTTQGSLKSLPEWESNMHICLHFPSFSLGTIPRHL